MYNDILHSIAGSNAEEETDSDGEVDHEETQRRFRDLYIDYQVKRAEYQKQQWEVSKQRGSCP